MSREIKFRSWDKEERVIRTVLGFSLFHGAVSVDIGNGKYLQDDTERFELMQYTGLKDNNDVGIYEGDYVKCKWGFDDWSGIVEFIDGLFCVNPISDLKFPSAINECSFLEVIGNIYENPELLEE